MRSVTRAGESEPSKWTAIKSRSSTTRNGKGSLQADRGKPSSRRPLRVLVGLSEIVWYYRNLRAGFEALGYDCWQINLDAEVTFDSISDSNLLLARWIRRTTAQRARLSRSSPIQKSLVIAADKVLRALLFAWAAIRCDVFVLGRGTYFLHPSELALLRILNRKVICIFHGSDERPPYINGSAIVGEGMDATRRCINRTRDVARLVKAIDRHANAIVSNPLSAHFHNRDVVIYQRIGQPFPAVKDVALTAREGPVQIVHSPSNPVAKGSDRIREAIEAVRQRGHAIELVELIDVPNSEVQRRLAECDFVVDQAYSDIPMSGFVAEAAAFGRPAIVGGYGWDDLASIVPRSDWPPVECCHPDNLAGAIERFVVDPAYRRDMGTRARQFLIDNGEASIVAERLIRLCDGNVAAEWSFSPMSLRYMQGCGMSEERAKESIRSVVEVGGSAALALEDNPALETQFLSFAGVK